MFFLLKNPFTDMYACVEVMAGSCSYLCKKRPSRRCVTTCSTALLSKDKNSARSISFSTSIPTSNAIITPVAVAGIPQLITVGLVGLCEDRNSSFMRGAGQGPDMIRKALRCDSSNSWSELGCDITEHVRDYGNSTVPLSPSCADMVSSLTPIFTDLLSKGHVPLTLGGDHSATYALCKALTPTTGPLVMLHLDAHPDLYHNFEDNPNSHASPFARICEEGMCLPGRLVQAGIRTLNAHQKEQASRFGVTVLEARHCPTSLVDTGRLLRSLIKPTDKVYLSLDIDALDPAHAPGVSHREPGGLTTRQALNFIQSCPGIIVGMDLVEYNVVRDVDGMTATVGAKLVKEMVGRIVCGADDGKGEFVY